MLLLVFSSADLISKSEVCKFLYITKLIAKAEQKNNTYETYMCGAYSKY